MRENIDLKRSATVMFSLVIAVVVIYLLILVMASWPVREYSIDKAAVLGDSFGIINALFSGLAFAGLIVTILLQGEELKESRRIFVAQKFEDAFYRLLAFYKENLNDISVQATNGDVFKGIGGLSAQLRLFTSAIKPLIKHLDNDIEIYRYAIYKEAQKLLAPQARYLGTFESVLSLVMNEVVDIRDRKFYVKIIASQLTIHEVKYIFYRCLVSKTESPIVKLVNDTKVIDMRISETGIKPEIISLYNYIHGSEMPLHKDRTDSPYTKTEERKMNTIIRKNFQGNKKCLLNNEKFCKEAS